jgi:predicted phage terminase large subunit-like protein
MATAATVTSRDALIGTLELVAANDLIPHAPTERQLAFLAEPALEALYGGAAGGGKTDALLMGALLYAHIPGYSALILRRTYPDLAQPGGIMSRAREWLAGRVRWQESAHRAIVPGGMTLQFGHLEAENDRFRYQGGEYQYIGVDELTQFLERDYRYLFSRLRRVRGVEVPLRMRAGSNPGGLGHDWVRRRFIDVTAPDRAFHAARLADNPHLDREQYERSLEHLDPVTRAQLLRGDWTARADAQLFRREWFEVVDAAPAVTGSRPVRFWDLAASADDEGRDPDYTVGLKLWRSDHGELYVLDVVRFRRRPHEVQHLVATVAAQDGPDCRQRMQQDPGQAGKDQIDEYRRRVLAGHDFQGLVITGKKWVRAQPVSGQAGAGHVKLVRGSWIDAFLDELEAFGPDEREYEHDDQVDALSGAYSVLAPVGRSSLSTLQQIAQARGNGDRIPEALRARRSGLLD